MWISIQGNRAYWENLKELSIQILKAMMGIDVPETLPTPSSFQKHLIFMSRLSFPLCEACPLKRKTELPPRKITLGATPQRTHWVTCVIMKCYLYLQRNNMSEEQSPKRIKSKKPFFNSSTDLPIWLKMVVFCLFVWFFGDCGKWKHRAGTARTWRLAWEELCFKGESCLNARTRLPCTQRDAVCSGSPQCYLQGVISIAYNSISAWKQRFYRESFLAEGGKNPLQ